MSASFKHLPQKADGHATVVRLTTGTRVAALVNFKYDDDLRVAFRKEFPNSYWDSLQKRWIIPGEDSVDRAINFFSNRNFIVG